MTDVSASTRGSGRTGRKRDQGGNPVSRFFRSISLFISQILDELRKVVRPTRNELWNYTIVVIVFVTVMMALVAGMDYGFGKLVALAFGNGG
jgi:preprotein translocase subunit SecE